MDATITSMVDYKQKKLESSLSDMWTLWFAYPTTIHIPIVYMYYIPPFFWGIKIV